MSRANVKLNGRKVYGADGWAARELLKVAALLRSAQDSQHAPSAAAAERDRDTHHYDVSGRVSMLLKVAALLYGHRGWVIRTAALGGSPALKEHQLC